MINGVFDVTTAQYAAIKATLVGSSDTYIGESDGTLITDDTSLYTVIGTALSAPPDLMAQVSNPSWFDDEITTMYWFEDAQGRQRYQQYVLALFNPDRVVVDDGWDWRGLLQRAADYWGVDIVNCEVDGEVRGFAVYLVHREAITS